MLYNSIHTGEDIDAGISKTQGVASNATANATDAQLRDRATHTGTQPLSSISDAGSALSVIATNNAGLFEPNPTFAHMLWFDTNNDLMKVRNEANSAWVIVAKKDGSGWTPYRQGTALGTASVQPDNRYAHRSNNLSDLESRSISRANLGAAEDSSDPNFSNDPNAAARRGLVQQKLINLILDTIPELVAAELHATGSAPMYACRAWVNFDGTGTVAIRAGGNVSSITDNGTGDYTINFATALPDANYAINTTIGTFSATDAGTRGVGVATDGYTGSIINMTTSAIRILTGQYTDTSLVMASIFR